MQKFKNFDLRTRMLSLQNVIIVGMEQNCLIIDTHSLSKRNIIGQSPTTLSKEVTVRREKVHLYFESSVIVVIAIGIHHKGFESSSR